MVRYSFPVGLLHFLLHAGLIPAQAHNLLLAERTLMRDAITQHKL